MADEASAALLMLKSLFARNQRLLATNPDKTPPPSDDGTNQLLFDDAVFDNF